MTMAHRPTLHDMVKAAMEGTVARVDVNNEAARQLAGHRGEESTKTASEVSPEHYSTEHITKMANALEFIAGSVKSAEEGPGEGPGALKVQEATSEGSLLEAGQSGEAIPKFRMPNTTSTQPEEVQSGAANTGMETDDDTMHGEQPVSPISNQTAPLTSKEGSAQDSLFAANLQRLGLSKVAGGKAPPAPKRPVGKAPVKQLRKMAEDAINPAQISGGKENPPDASASGVDVPRQPSDVTSQVRSMLSSNQAAIDYTKGEAKADPKKDVNQVLEQPALTTAGDSVLQKVLDNTSQAGVKISGAKASLAGDTMKVAAARALLSNLMDKVASEKGGKKKQKESMMGGAPASPSAASGFTASSLG